MNAPSPPPESGDTAPRWLVWMTAVYLTLPVMIFLVGWLRPFWALVSVASALAIGKGLAPGKNVNPAAPSRASRLKWWQGITLLLVLAFVAGTNGAGGFGVQNWDWIKHNAILRDLVDKPWPVIYTTDKGEVALAYYLAYYLPAAVAGKMLGWQAANVAIYGWTVLGCFLAAVWLMMLSGARWWAALGMLVLFSGLDLLGDALWWHPRETLQWVNNFDAEWWPKLWTLPSNLTLIAYAPQHAIAGWLFTALLVAGLRARPASFPIGGLLALSLLWSPFLTVGLFALAGLWFLGHRARLSGCIRAQFRPANLTAVPLALVLALYFQSRNVPFELPHYLYPSRNIIAMGSFYLTPSRTGFAEFAPAYVLTMLLEFGTLALLLLKALPKEDRADRFLLAGAVATLLALPWFHYGHYNDLVMRICIPALWVLQILSLQALVGPLKSRQAGRPSRLRMAIIVVLSLGALYPMNMLRITSNRLAERSWRVVALPLRDQVPDLFRQQRQSRRHLFSIGQYLGSVHSWFFLFLAREAPRPLPGAAPGDAEHSR